MTLSIDLDWEEAFIYRPGRTVELKSQPGKVDTIERYDAMMVPPIWLVNDPRPRYPHELQLVPKPLLKTGSARPKSTAHPARRKVVHPSCPIAP